MWTMLFFMDRREAFSWSAKEIDRDSVEVLRILAAFSRVIAETSSLFETTEDICAHAVDGIGSPFFEFFE